MPEIKPGIMGKIDLTVSQKETARFVQSGGADVLATPVLIRLAEQAAWQSVQPFLENGFDTVGTFISLNHLSPTPVGLSITCQTRLTAVEGRKLCFDIEAFDPTGLIASGKHERFIINTVRFKEKAESKKISHES